MNVIIYCRVSSRDQVEGTSLEFQEAACRDWAARNRAAISRIFIEEGESAKFADRTQLLEALNFCKDTSRRIDALVVWKLDRFARNIEDHYLVKATLRRMGVKIVSVTEPVDTDPNGKLMEAILAGFAQFDNDIRALRTINGMRQRLKDGIFPWKPPLGYLPPRNGKKRDPDRPDPATFGVLKEAWRMFATGGYTKAEILRFLRSRGVQGYRGGPISAQAIDNIFGNLYYAGVLTDPWSHEEYAGRHVPMVTIEAFAAVQQATARRSRSTPHHRFHPDFPIRGLVRCPACAWPLTAAWTTGSKTGRPYAYYSCPHRACERGRKSIPAAFVHDEFNAFLAGLSLTAGVVDGVIASLHDHAEVDTASARQAAQRRQERLADLQQQFAELLTVRTKQLISDREFEQQRDLVRAAMHELQAAGRLDDAPPLTAEEADGLKHALADLPRIWEGLPGPEKRVFGLLVFPAGYQYGGVRTAHRGPLFAVFEGSGDPLSNWVSLTTPSTNAILADIRAFLQIVETVLMPRRLAA